MESFFCDVAGTRVLHMNDIEYTANKNRYLYEREMYDVARNILDVALETFQDKMTLAFASATDLSGLIDLDMANPAKALSSFV